MCCSGAAGAARDVEDMMVKDHVLVWLDRREADFAHMADAIWEHPEFALEESFASKLQADYLEKAGFRVAWGGGGMPTAFIAEWGGGEPVIGFLGEFDALKNLSQKRSAVPDPVVPGGLGHGCGHNLLGTGAVAAAAAVKDWLESSGTPGVVRYYGCPAEESLIGKVFMARDGAFDDLDAAFNFHPWNSNSPNKGSFNALDNLKFHFHGRAAHAGASPHLGRSALDAVELMNVGANYLREHVEPEVRIHYVITNGGDLPNVVPAEAEVWYFVRAPRRTQLEKVTDRLRRIAQGAAMMTETEVEETYITGCYDLLNNSYLADLQYEAMREIGPIRFTDDEIAFAGRINSGYPEETRQSVFKSLRLPDDLRELPLIAENFPANDEGKVQAGSSDVGDASWIAPLSLLNTTCCPSGVPLHSWGMAASAGTSIGHKGMMHAAKIMALSAVALYSDPERVRKARDEFEKATGGRAYRSPLPAGAKPPLA